MAEPDLGELLDELERRGGVIVEVDGQRHEVRATLIRDIHNRPWLNLDDVRLLAKACETTKTVEVNAAGEICAVVPADCTASGFSGEGRCIEPAVKDGLCIGHSSRTGERPLIAEYDQSLHSRNERMRNR